MEWYFILILGALLGASFGLLVRGFTLELRDVVVDRLARRMQASAQGLPGLYFRFWQDSFSGSQDSALRFWLALVGATGLVGRAVYYCLNQAAKVTSTVLMERSLKAEAAMHESRQILLRNETARIRREWDAREATRVAEGSIQGAVIAEGKAEAADAKRQIIWHDVPTKSEVIRKKFPEAEEAKPRIEWHSDREVRRAGNPIAAFYSGHIEEVA